MKIYVMGAGIAGVTVAYVLASRGHAVEVIEREDAPALQTSFANGGQLSYSHAEPWAHPGVLPKVVKWMFKEDAPLVFRPRLDAAMWKWGLQFLQNCTQKRADANTRTMLRLALYSRGKMEMIRRDTGVEFDFLEKGILHIFSHQKEFDAAVRQARFQETLGAEEEVLSFAECVAREPALANIGKPVVGGIYAPGDQSGNLFSFTQALAEYCKQHLGVSFRFGVAVERLEADAGSMTAIHTTAGVMQADAYVMAMGCWSVPLSKTIGVRVPIYPMKGYSVTAKAWEGAPFVSITDDENKVVFSRLGEKIRAAGTAEFAGYSTSVKEKRILPILRCMHEMFPASQKTATMDTVGKWGCIRPQTPDGPPLVGTTKYPNLFLHTGHGTLGWTQSAGSSHLLADIMEGRPTEIPAWGLEPGRYSIF